MPASRTALLRLLPAVVVAALVTGACSGDDDEPERDGTTVDEEAPGTPPDVAAADVPDPCALLEPEELEAELGSPFGEGEPTDEAATGTRQCSWTNADAPPVKTFTVVVGNDASLEAAFGRDAAEFFTLTRRALETSRSIDEPDLGLGDESYLAGSYVYVLDGSTTYTFSTFAGESPEAIAGLKALASTALDG